MIVRALDVNHDWTFGKGKNNYLKNLQAIVQKIDTRLNSYLGDCFFDLGAGLNWFNLLGSKNQRGLNLAVSAVILNTANVTGILQLSIVVDAERRVTIKYQVQTTYSKASGIFQFDGATKIG